MSVQTDCEMLSVQAMEAYAKKFHVSGNDVVALFHENKVFETVIMVNKILYEIMLEK